MSALALALARTPLFEDLSSEALDDIAQYMQPRSFRAREVICQENEPGNSLFVIQDGLALVTIARHDSEGISDSGRVVARLRRGDVVGEMSLITGEPRSATVIAAVPTTVLELGQDAFAVLLTQHPAVVLNLNRILSRRLARTTLQQIDRQRGEAVALLVGLRGGPLVSDIAQATESASPRSVATLDARTYTYSQTFSLGLSEESRADGHMEDATLESALAMLDDLLADHGTVVIVANIDQENVSVLLDHMDRVIALASEDEATRLASTLRGYPASQATRQYRIEVALLSESPEVPTPRTIEDMDVIRILNAGQIAPVLNYSLKSAPGGRDVAWLGRHISRTKLGLALGAGGAKGYAHIGALHVLSKAGYTVDYVAGSSIGAMIGSWLAMGMSAGAVESTMRDAFSPDNVAAMFKLSMAGTSTGLDTMTRVCRESTQDRSFADLAIPLTVMSVDLNTRQPAPIREGPLWQALLAATALAGMFPPYVRTPPASAEQRLVDGLALVPVPTGSVVEAGADISVSVNIMSRETLPAWPGEKPPEPPPARAGSRMLDTLLEVMDLAQLDSSVRHAALADVVLTPRFGPASWRDFHMADLFLAAGQQVAEEHLTSLQSLARPQAPDLYTKGEVYGTAVHV